MVGEIRIYFEGDERLRPGFAGFLKSIIDTAREHRINFHLVSCGARAIKDFMIALATHPDAVNFLLMDAEGPDDGKLLINAKSHSAWNPPNGMDTSDSQVHFMTQVMESWFLADKEALVRFFGDNFRIKRLPANPQVEEIDKRDVLNGLKEATQVTQKGSYHKTRHAPELLRNISPRLVRGAAPNCRRLFVVLEEKLRE